MKIENKTTTTTHTVSLRVNGTTVGDCQVDPNMPLNQFVTQSAKNYGVRSFCVMGDGNQVGKDKKDAAISNFAKIDIIAKDARGGQ